MDQIEKKQSIAYILPETAMSGGAAIVFNHVNRLRDRGYETSVIVERGTTKFAWFKNRAPILDIEDVRNKKVPFDILVATHWTTVKSLKKLESKRKVYFVQSDERRFIPIDSEIDGCEATYREKFEYMTEAKWIQRWLLQEFGHEAYYVPNGLDLNIFNNKEGIGPKNKKRPRVLLEGTVNIPFKGMRVAFDAVKDLDCDIWIVTNGGEATQEMKKRADRCLSKVPIYEMKKYYSSCDVFLKMSRVEGFFGPPLEAMACGCAVVVAKCTGYDEYIVAGQNALVVETGDVNGAKQAVDRLLIDKGLRKKLINNGYKTSMDWSWERSINLLERMIKGEAKKVFYDENVPERYDYKKTMDEVRYLAELIRFVSPNEAGLLQEITRLRKETITNRVFRKIRWVLFGR